MNQLIEWSDGNPGAITFLASLFRPENSATGFNILKTLEKATTIRGTNLYVLWSDLCGKDIEKVEMLCNNCPIEILEDACSRQDYSGRALVAEYLQD